MGGPTTHDVGAIYDPMIVRRFACSVVRVGIARPVVPVQHVRNPCLIRRRHVFHPSIDKFHRNSIVTHAFAFPVHHARKTVISCAKGAHASVFLHANDCCSFRDSFGSGGEDLGDILGVRNLLLLSIGRRRDKERQYCDSENCP